MDPTVFNLGVIAVLGLTTVLTAFLGLQWVKYRALDGNYVKEKVKHYSDLAAEYKEDAKHWKGKFNQSKQAVQVEGDFNLDDEGDVASLAKEILPGIMQMLPSDVQKKAQGLLNNPDLIKQLVGLYEKHPEEIQSLLSGFLKKAGVKGKSADQPDTEPQIENYA